MTRRLLATGYGEPATVLSLVDVDAASPGDGEVVVSIEAAGLNPFDVKRVHGAMGADPAKLPLVLGGEAAGAVRVAADGTGFAPGDRVVVYPATGAFADEIVAPVTNVHRLPDAVTTETAAGLLLAGVTAYDTIATVDVGADDVVLIHGGSGAVGSVATSLAVARGATVIATASPANHEYLRGLGATPIGHDGDIAASVRAAVDAPVSAVIDTVGNDAAIDASLQLVPADRIVSIAAFGRADDGIVLLDGSSEASRAHRRDAVRPLLDAVADGRIAVDIAATYPLTEAAAAFDALAGPHPRGKYLIVP
ncbi:quinone oxidoreductase family protein [Gordonia humi]|uniref:NADPH:quinone reductase-like Zn-dependent oxidoreductase n=1 Tax=Gordonia humi TaxID=686429 RepID=A0A840EX88_9ACTN|nr:NADP-dependent oxidoreductase [Gordonia humi]MBB4137615.1 NADPH:quinone reductase-like Zn-dependent oxidoreductase [Gordonia humi]